MCDHGHESSMITEDQQMPRVLGVTCSSADAYLTVIDVHPTSYVHDIVAVGPEKVSPVPGGDHGDRLVRTLGEWGRVLAEIAPDAVALLLPETDRRAQKVHASWAPRCETETLVGLAAGLARTPHDRIARATVRSRLSLDKLDVAAKAEPPHGKYWAHRALALFAARTLTAVAVERGWPARLPPGVGLFDEKDP
jgi:hypothetical protein